MIIQLHKTRLYVQTKDNTFWQDGYKIISILRLFPSLYQKKKKKSGNLKKIKLSQRNVFPCLQLTLAINCVFTLNVHHVHHLETAMSALFFLTETQISFPGDTSYLHYPGFTLGHLFLPRVRLTYTSMGIFIILPPGGSCNILRRCFD